MTSASATRPHRTLRTSGLGATEPRETMRVLPGVLQLPLTFLTGRPYRGQAAVHLTPSFHLAAAVADMVVGVTATALLLGGGGWWLAALPVSWAVTLHGMRNLRMMIYHQCAHRNMWRRATPDGLLGRMCASLLLVQNFGRYTQEHVAEHHSRRHMTLRDPTVQAILVSLRLRPGMTRGQMWRRLLATMASPRYHAAFAVARIRSFAHGSDRRERILVAGVYGSAVVAAWLTGGWSVLVVGWLVPLFPLFQLSNTLRLCVKHTFPPAGEHRLSARDQLAMLTNAIFLGEPAPARRAGCRAWLRWWSRMLLVHFPARYLVLTGDTTCHDFHHRQPRAAQWADYVFARQRDVEAGCRGWPPYREVWGLVAAIDVVLDSLAVADPAVYDVRLVGSVSSRDLFAAFDD